MDEDQTYPYSTMDEKEYGPSLQDVTKHTTIFQKIASIYQRLSTLTWITMVFGSVPFFAFLCISPSLRIFALVYVLWMYYDRRTPHTGGRRLLGTRKMSFWQTRRDYFPVKLIKTAELPADTSYLFAAFPHGIWAFGAATNICSDLNHFDEAFPGLTPYVHVMSFFFRVPFLRELLLFIGSCAVSPECILHVLNSPGNVSVIYVGGYPEMLRSSPGTNTIVLRNRKGFVKLALKTGSSLVPVFTFGNTDAYDHIEWYRKFQEIIFSTFHSKIVPFGRGPCRLDRLFGLLPHRRPITTVVGSPIKLPKVEDPSDELVDKFHGLFVQELTALFEKYKVKYDSRGEQATLSIE